jgi:hypothetical protein
MQYSDKDWALLLAAKLRQVYRELDVINTSLAHCGYDTPEKVAALMEEVVNQR